MSYPNHHWFVHKYTQNWLKFIYIFIENTKETTKPLCSKKTLIIISFVVTIIIIVLISTGVYFGVKNSDVTNSNNDATNNTNPNSNTTNSVSVNNDTLVMVDRNDWKSLKNHGTGNLVHPTKNVVIAHTVTLECHTRVNKTPIYWT